jgi:hypothetical protein
MTGPRTRPAGRTVFAFNVAPFWLEPKQALAIVGRQPSPSGAG